MPPSNTPEEKIISTTAQPAPETPGITSATQRNLITLSSAVVFFSFFLPWVNILGANIRGLDIQHNFSSYRLVWLLPGLAVATLLLNVCGQPTNLARRLAGLCPFVILAYALNLMGSDLLRIVAVGGWLALIGGVALVCIPNVRKPTKLS